jgi:hypothetical protein
MTPISGLLSELEDPFQLFPLQEVTRSLAKLAESAEDYLVERAGWWGVSSKFRSVDEEHEAEVYNLLIGSAFVLGQTAITQSVAIVTKIRDTAGNPPWLPDGRAEVLKIEAAIHQPTGLSETILFDAVANYFKHRQEWPSDWVPLNARGSQRATIETIRSLGLVPGSDSNLDTAMRELGFGIQGIAFLAERIQSWRERLAANLRKRLVEHNLL